MTNERVEAATSGHLIQMVDILFALVLSQGIATFHDAPFGSNLPVWIVLATIYYTIVRSFVAWHEAIEERCYRILTPDSRTTELWRLYIDAFIVAVYAYMWFAAERLKSHGDTDIRRLLWAFPLLFLLYGLWGHLRHVAWGDDDFDFRILFVFGFAYVLLASMYTIGRSKTSVLDSSTANSIVLGVAFFLMFFYRSINFWQGDRYKNRARRFGLPRPQLPRLRTLS